MSWKFDQDVARTFPAHARSHIPNYEAVIGLCVALCEDYGKDAAILDVGVATGETISQLNSAGFTNLFGVDNSRAMLDQCPDGIATLILSESFPEAREFDVVLMNWTLHFIREKEDYLQDIFEGLRPGGLLVLSEKISKADFPSRHYHQFKRRQGLSEAEIRQKARSLEHVMYINDVPWYFRALSKAGFREVHLVNAFWCFATFVCIKPSGSREDLQAAFRSGPGSGAGATG